MASSVEMKAREVVRQAIASLQARGYDVNPYSVAIEARLPRWFIANNNSLMGMLAEARGAARNGNGAGSGEDLAQKVQRLSKELEESNWEITVLRRYFQESKTENQSLKEQIAQVQQQLQEAKQHSDASTNMQLAWQQGFAAGQQSILTEQVRTATDVSALAPGTTGGAPANNDLVQSGDKSSEQIVAYVADTLNISDPDVLNDPFTAKLLNALQGEEQDLVDQAVTVPPSAVMNTNGESGAASPEPVRVAPGETQSKGFAGAVHTPDLYDGDHDLIDTALLEEHNESEITDRFTAEELHNLFQNRYVRHDDPPENLRTSTSEAPSAPPPPQPAKKFVGSKHASSTEALPTIPRVIPPDIRKACKLLGVVPEDISRATVLEAWKKEMAKPGVHPDTGGDTEMAIYLNTAKDKLMRWIENQTPKLGKKFGQQGRTGEAPKHQPKPE